MGNKHVSEILSFICEVDGKCMWMKENEPLTLAGKTTVACFKLLGWIYNSKGRKSNGFDEYGHGLVLMFLMRLVFWRPIFVTI